MKLNKTNMKKKLGMSDEEIQLVSNYQEAFSNLQDTDKDAIVDGRTLWEELKVVHDFNDWMKKQLGLVDAIEGAEFHVYFKGDVNFTKEEIENMSPQQRSRHGISVEYTLKLDIAKEIAMIVGATPRINKETKELSKLARKYFITIEKAIRLAKEWEETRVESKKLHKQMMATYEEVHMANYNRKPRDYGSLQEDIYYICFDMSTKELKDKLDIKYHQTVPEWVEEKIEKALCYTYSRMIVMLEMGIMDKDERFNTVAKMFDKKFGGVIEI